MERLGEAAVGALDLGHRRARLEAQRPIRIERHEAAYGCVAHDASVRRARSGISRSSSPTGASSNEAIASAAGRPCGSGVIGRW